MTRSDFAGAATLVAMALSLCACNPHGPVKPAAEAPKGDKALQAEVAQNIADENAHDAAKVASHYAPDSEAIMLGRPSLVGPAAVQANAAQTFAAVPDFHFELATQKLDVAASGELAVLRATYAVTGTDPGSGKSLASNGAYVAAYRRQADGAWKIEWSVVSSVQPTAAAQVDRPADARAHGAHRRGPRGRPHRFRHYRYR